MAQAETLFDASEITVSMGPQHPSTHGVLQVKLKLDGERVLDAECVIGYLHRGVEKLGEAQTYGQFVPTLDRMDYIAAVSNCLGYCETIEKLLGMTAPPRAQYIRVIMTELNRITSHLLWLGTHALDIGAMTVFLYCFREREEILKIFENYCGARLTTHMFRIGGTQYEMYEGFQDQVRTFIKDFPRKVDEYETLLTENRIWIGPHARCRHHLRKRRHRYGADRAEPARFRRAVGSAQGQALLHLFGFRFRYSRR